MVRVVLDSSSLEKSYTEKLAKAPKEAKQAFSRMLLDAERHAQMVVAKQISEVYTITSADVKKPETADAYVGGSAEAVELIYRGRTLTWHHFMYAPRTRLRGKQVLKGAVKKAGGLKPAGPTSFIGGTGAKLAGKVQSIPFWRVGKERTPIKALHGPSVPQMVLEETEVVPTVLEDLGPYMQERFEHHFNFFSSKG